MKKYKIISLNNRTYKNLQKKRNRHRYIDKLSKTCEKSWKLKKYDPIDKIILFANFLK